ncbi:MAG: hypothetical protein QG577_124 [Thermodesulfobacteriota bacterium]|nr:hypothetical protein [Thermodesulfobacteriota bacterium]
MELTDTMNTYMKYASMDRTKFLGPTSLEEQAYCEWFAAEVFSGRGEIVELGSWLGSLTVSTARGLALNTLAQPNCRIIQTYDLFRWNVGFEDWVKGTPYEQRFRPNESFRTLYEEIIAPYRTGASIVVHQEDLSRSKWDGTPIEFLINDAWKTVPIMANIIDNFFPSLLTGSVVFHQDYLWVTESQIQIAMFLLRDYFEFPSRIENSCGVAFRKTRDIDQEIISDLAARASYLDFSNEEIEAAFQWSRSLFDDPEAQLVVDGAKGWMLGAIGEIDRARSVFQDIKGSEHREHWFYKFQEDILRQWGYDYLMD